MKPIAAFQRIIVSIFCVFGLLLGGQVSAFAQATDAEQETKPDAAQLESPQEMPISEDVPSVDEALKAVDDAERALLDAVKAERAQVQSAETPVVVDDEVQSDGKLDLLKDPESLLEMGRSLLDKLVTWITSLPFLAQVGAIILAIFLSPILAAMLRKRLFFLKDPPPQDAKLKIAREYVYRSGNFLRAVMLVALLALFAVILKAIGPLGEDWLVKLAQGVAVVFLLYKAIREFITNDLFKKMAIWTIIPVALLAVFGFFDSFIAFLNSSTIMKMGDTPITLMTLIRLAIFGGFFFWLGNLSNDKGQTAIRSQESLDIATREVVAKLFQIILSVVLFVLILSFAGIPLSGLVIVFSAIGLGIGFGLQPLAANFVSGLIILFDRSVRKGDFIVLPDGQEGYVDAINMRSTTVETTDGKDIMVPNTTFIEGTYENWTHKDPRQRYEVYFMVAYDTDIDRLEDILIPEIAAYDKVLMEPEKPDLELREFGDFGIKFAIEFWVSGIDDGPNKFTSDLNFIVWRALKANGIQMPLPQREVRLLSEK